MKSLHLLGLVLAVGLGAVVARSEADGPRVELPHTQRRELVSTRMGWTYQLSINLPEDYATSGKTYPVLYVLDGVWNFALLAGIEDGLYYGQRLPALIIVAVDYGLPYDGIMRRREHDFTPTDWAKHPGSGGAAEFLAFLEKELVPYIDRTFRTNPADRALLGHSYGGLFGVYAWLERPALFQRIVAASPSLRWDDECLTKLAAARLAQQEFPSRLDLSMGSAEDPEAIAAVQRFAALLEKSPPRSGTWDFTLYPGENHTSVKPLSLTHGLAWVYRP